MASAKVYAYPEERQHQRWSTQAEEWGVSMSTFIKYAVEAGLKRFDMASAEVEADVEHLQAVSGALRTENKGLRARVAALEAERDRSEREYLYQFIRGNPGVDESRLADYLRSTVSLRIKDHLAALEEKEIRTETEDSGGIHYYPAGIDEEPAEQPSTRFVSTNQEDRWSPFEEGKQ